jgi:hypothetical protein
MNQLRTIGMRQGETCNFFGCEGIMKFVRREYHELDKNIVELCVVTECSECGVEALTRSSES